MYALGLEIHAQIEARTKLFSPGTIISQKNTGLGLFDLALPGTLPQLNRHVVDQAMRAALALECKINLTSHFDRKHYFYQDLPLGFQITQQQRPLGYDGSLQFFSADGVGAIVPGTVNVQRLQIEQDSAKSIHDLNDYYTLVDFARAGAALIEVVFAPTLRTAKQASAVISTVQQLFRHINISSGNLEDGSMRCDVNISVARYDFQEAIGSQSSGPKLLYRGNRVEVKNLNSLQRVEDAANYEIDRHITEMMKEDWSINKETRGFDVLSGRTFALRAKEDAVDYRFFPDPDLPPLVITAEELEEYKKNLPELPMETIARLKRQYALNEYQISVLFKLQVVKLFEDVIKLCDPNRRVTVARNVFNWMSCDLAGICSYYDVSLVAFPITAEQIYAIVCSIEKEKLTTPQIKKILIHLFDNKGRKEASLSEIVSELGLVKLDDEKTIRGFCMQVIHDPSNTTYLNKFKSGKSGVFNYFFGAVMKKSNGQADHVMVRKQLEQLLKECA